MHNNTSTSSKAHPPKGPHTSLRRQRAQATKERQEHVPDVICEEEKQFKVNIEGKKTVGPMSGGPEDLSLLQSFKDHVAYYVWNGKGRDPLKMVHHAHKLEHWDLGKECDEFKQKVIDSGLGNLTLFSYKFINRVLVSAFVERWHPETNTFHLPFGEMTITIDDVKQILGIPVTGKAFVGFSTIEKEESVTLLQKGLGLSREVIDEELTGPGRGISVRMEWLRKHLSSPESLDEKKRTEETINCAVRGYLLYLLGCTLFADKSGSKVSVAYMRMLLEVDKVKDYAWGVNGLAYLYRQLGLASRNDVKQITGYLTLLEAWVYEHFRMVKGTPNLDYTEDKPRMARWLTNQTSGNMLSQILSLRQEMDSMSLYDVYWDPYRDSSDDHVFDEVTFYTGCITCFDIVEPYHPDRVLRQLGRVQDIPPEPLKPARASRAASGKNYDVDYTHYQYWERWHNHVLAEKERGPQVLNPWDCTERYIEWFHKVSHPRVQNPSFSKGTKRPAPVFQPKYATGDGNNWRPHRDQALRLLEESFALGVDQDVPTMLERERKVYDALRFDYVVQEGEEETQEEEVSQHKKKKIEQGQGESEQCLEANGVESGKAHS